jgi:hypothetical protein
MMSIQTLQQTAGHDGLIVFKAFSAPPLVSWTFGH